MPRIVALTLLLAAAGQTVAIADKHRRPNVLFIAIDDLRPALRCYGDALAKSPNIDRFAKTARQFNRAYVQQAVCGPSRTSILTGRLPDETRVWHNRNRFRDTLPDLVTLPQLFKQNGYVTLGYGKLFSGNERELDPESWSEELLRKKDWKNYVLPKNQGKAKKQAAFEAPDVPGDVYPDGKLATLAVDTLERLKKEDQPFFLGVGFFKPHLPFNAPKKYWDLYDADSFAVTESITQPVEGVPKIAFHSHRELGGYKGVPGDEEVNAEQTQQLRHGYYACVSYIDALVGRVLDALDRLGLAKSTVVVLWGDHGFALGESSRWCKGTNFELDTRVPLLIRTPQLQQPGVATDSLVEMVDLYPTLAETAGLKTPTDVSGRSFAPLLSNPKAAGRDAVLSQFNRPWTSKTPEVMGYSIRTLSHRYTRWIDWQSRKTITEELYDYAATQSARLTSGQILEHRNIAASNTALVKRMSDRMDEVLASRLETANK